MESAQHVFDLTKINEDYKRTTVSLRRQLKEVEMNKSETAVVASLRAQLKQAKANVSMNTMIN